MKGQLFKEENKSRFLLMIIFLAFAVRSSVFSSVFSSGKVTLLGADTYYHAHRILYTVSHFPGTITFDRYINYPYGANIGWPPLYDQFIALISLIVGLGDPSPFTIEATTAVVPMILGVLTVLVVFLLTEKIFNWQAGIISSVIFAITPAHVYVSFLGYADHHVAETFLSTTVFLFFLKALSHSKNNSLTFNNLKENFAKNSLFSVLSGVVLSLAIFTWNGAPIFLGLIGIYILVQFLIDRKKENNSEYLIITGGTAFLVSLLIITPVAINQGFIFVYNSYLPSFFHVGFISGLVLLCVLLGLMLKIPFQKWWHHLLILSGLFSGALFSIKTFSPLFYISASSGINYLFGGGVLGTIQEAVPLFFNPFTGFTFAFIWQAFALSSIAALLSFVYYMNNTVRNENRPEAVFLIVWTLIVLALTILQRRFVYLLSVNIAIFSGYFVMLIYSRFTPEKEMPIRKRKKKAQKKVKKQMNPGLIIALLILIIISVPDLSVIRSMATDGLPVPDPDLKESIIWLKENSPRTSYLNDFDHTAEYGIMSWWDYGNWILYLSKRPVVANNFQTGIEDAANFLTETDEEIASEILVKRNVRYILTDAQMLKLKFRSIAMLAGKNPDEYYGTQDPVEKAGIQSVDRENAKFFNTMLSKLHVFDGNGLSHYRLIYESGTYAIRGPDIKYVKIFEHVPGATISGKTDNDADVEIFLEVLTNQGRTYTYTKKVTPNNGKYEVTVPYSTQDNIYRTTAIGNYILQNGIMSRTVSISEIDIQEGNNIQVDLI